MGTVTRLSQAVVGLLDENREWIRSLKKATIVPVALLTFSRLIAVHMAQPSFEAILHREAKLCEWLLREKFGDCLPLGRDLLSSSYAHLRLPNFNPFGLISFTDHPSCTSISQVPFLLYF